ncbi:hypothetical protein KP509_08G021600 [Ceratopteris richardii]|uniref:TIR domain-containing protein n=1 Tax=Ceratopteris richardii TaxID=49495 RepID=A0A8T2UER7_CERRI|nr:hypothetical protein KP509_08G021600 [Ceratopteris richardii]
MMTQEYDVFICHRGETKRNFVSVLGGMLRSKGITCFVDYRMPTGNDVQLEINGAIEKSKVFIVVLSPDFAGSTWCLDEIGEIMRIRDLRGTPRKVIPVFYDVQKKDTLYDLTQVKRSNAEKINRWGKALEDVCKLDEFVYDSSSTLQWEKSQEIVAKVEDFLISHRTIPDQGTKMPIWRECINYDVFICHWHLDTQRNVVSVLRGMLLCKSITPFVGGYGKDDGGSALDSDIIQAIENSRVHVIFLSPNFVCSKRCLEEVVYIMNIQGSPGTSDASRKPAVVPVFYDMKPSTARYQKEGKAYYLEEAQKSSTADDRERWASALHHLSLLHGLEYDSCSTFQWEKLYDVVKIVEASAKKITPRNYWSNHEALYVKKIDEVFKELELQEKREHVFLAGVYGRETSEFSDLLVQRLGSNFCRVCQLNNIMEKACQPNGIWKLVQQMRSDLIHPSKSSDLIQPSTSNDVKRCQLLLENERCLVVLDDLGNDIDKIKTLLEDLKSILRNNSLVVVASQFQHTLQELNVHKFINLSSLESKRDFLNICYTERDGINKAFLSHLSETFDMLGLDVRLLNEDKLMSDSTCLRDAKVTLCIISKSFSIDEFKSMFTNAAIPPKIVYYVSYGSYPTDESMPKSVFKMEVDFEKAESRIGMHDQLRDMGRHIIREERRDRAWDEETTNEILQERNAWSSLRGLSVWSHIPLPEDASDWTSLPLLRILVVKADWRDAERGRLCPQHIFRNVRCGGLRWLRWAGAPFEELPQGLCSTNIRVLELPDSNISEVPTASLPNLEHLDLSRCYKLKRLDMTSLSSLRVLVLDYCTSLATLSSLPTTLEILRLIMGVESVEDASLPNLRGLTIIRCPKLKRLALHATSLEELNLRECEGLQDLDSKGLSSLRVLVLDRCTSLATLSSLPTTLEILSLDMYWRWTGSLESVEDASLPNLRELTITRCPKLKRLALHATSLEKLNLGVCEGLQDLDSKGLSSLRVLVLDCCTSLATLSSLPTTLKILSFKMGCSLESVEDASLPNLRELTITRCPKLKRLALHATSLEKVNLWACEGLQDLDSKGLSSLPTTLESLNIDDASLPNLRELTITRCPKLKRLALHATSLEKLNLWGCEGLQDLDSKGLSSLRVLDLGGCKSLATLSSLPTTLEILSLEMADWLTGSLESVEDASLPNLRELTITRCPKLKRLALHATSLEKLNLWGCEGLQDLDSKGSIYTFL